MTEQDVLKNPKLFDFSFVGEQHFSIDEMLHQAYLEGKKDFQKELKNTIEKGLQTSAVLSSLFNEKLKDKNIDVKDMFLRILNFTEFECLALISDSDYYEKTKRWSAYNTARELNNSIDNLEIKFSLMPFSDEVQQDTITAEGFHFKYGAKQV